MRPEPAEIQAALQKLNGWMTLIRRVSREGGCPTSTHMAALSIFGC